MKDCILTFRSQTAASKATRYLKKTGVKVRVVSVDPSVTSKGCGWGVSFDCESADWIKNKLDARGISYGEILSGGI
ncbi:MAG: DUF3343 domain-containing protein [Clostridia bacterium]|nr:DUF3343 domain-containing protein [Clostridia bacterium]